MAISYSYPMGTPKLTDTVLGVQYEEMKDPAVKNFSINSIVTLAAGEITPTPGPMGPQGPIGITGATGSQGVQGEQGIQGVDGTVGPAGLEWRGTWNKFSSYIEDDAVAFSGSSYFCILDIEGETGNQNPSLDTTHWALLASQGATGLQGIQGVQGIQGIQGVPGVPTTLTLQQVTDEGADAYGNTINLKNSNISDSTIQFNVGDFFEPFIKIENLGAGSSGHFTKLGSSTIEFEGNGDYNTILEAGSGSNNTVTLPTENGTLALTNDIVTKVLKTTITTAQVLQLFTTPITILNSNNPLTVAYPINVYIKRNAGDAYTLVTNSFSIINDFGTAMTGNLNPNPLTNTSIGYFQSAITVTQNLSGGDKNVLYKLKANAGNPTLGTGNLDVYVTYIEITL